METSGNQEAARQSPVSRYLASQHSEVPHQPAPTQPMACADSDADNQPERFAVGLIVNNHFGVLNRISGLYAKRCYNIDALSVGETADPRYSRMTIISTGDIYMKDQVVRQLEKLIDVRSVKLLDPEETAFAQHMFIKIRLPEDSATADRYLNAPVRAGSTGTAEGTESAKSAGSAESNAGSGAQLISIPRQAKRHLLRLIDSYGGRVIDFGPKHLTAELTGSDEEVGPFIEAVRPYGILELSRSGDIAIGLGIDNTLYA